MDVAAQEWGIEYAFANDPDLETWERYEFFSHPSFALINPDGSLERKSAGIVATSDTESWILDHLVR